MEKKEITKEKKQITTIDVNNTSQSIFYYLNHNYAYVKLQQQICYYKGCKFEANEIINGIYLGNIESSYDKDMLKKLNITSIISVLYGYNPPYKEDFDYLVINALDSSDTNLYMVFDLCCEFINKVFEDKGNLLIHCMAGRSRSVTILAAYLIKNFGISDESAIDLIKSKRPIIGINDGFRQQLNKYYKYVNNL